MPEGKDEWFLYMIRCKNEQLYTGITTDVQRRLGEHQRGKGAKFLRGRGPLKLVFQQKIGSHSDALRMEAAIKKFPKAAKEEFIRSRQSG
jgi:putative endonuclease